MKSLHVAALCAFALAAGARGQGVGPDVIVGDLYNVGNWGSGTPVGGAPTASFSIGTISCNLGTSELNWFGGTNQKPVIGQNLYRWSNGRFEQIGMSWLKHGFYALAESLCASCMTPNPNNGTHLGVNCSDPYDASLNGDQGNIGPRFEVNAFTGFYPWPYTLVPNIPNNAATPANETSVLSGRINVLHSDLDPALNPGAQYFVEGHYVTPDDAAAGNGRNNASWRKVNVSGGGSTYSLNLVGSTTRQKPAIWAWKDVDPGVTIQNFDVPNEGRFVVGYRPVALGGGMWRHEYAVFNLNSDRAGGSFGVALPSGVSASNPYFKDVPYHSGEPQNSIDWALTNVAGSEISWACTTAPPSNTANAIRWGTLYNFGFDANKDWLPAATIGLFKPGSPASIAATFCREPGLSQQVSGGTYASTAVGYTFVDASAGSAGPAGDDAATTVNLPFTFNFWGQPQTQVIVSTNGYLAMIGQPGTVATNAAIPSGGAPNHFIAGYWDDLEVGTAGGAGGAATGWCRYITTGIAPFRTFTVQWNDAERLGTNSKVSFEISLSETTHFITLTTISTTGGPFPTTGGSATRGVENATGTGGLQLSYNQSGSVVAGTSLRLAYLQPTIPNTALLEMSGDGSVANPFVWHVVSSPSSPLSLFFDVAPGPSAIPGLPAFGLVGLGLTSSLTALADGTGVFGPLDPTAATSSCNEWSMTLPVALDPIPPALFDVYFQALVWNTGAPNGYAHLSVVTNY